MLAAHFERDAVALPTIPSVGITIAPGRRRGWSPGRRCGGGVPGEKL